MWKAVGLWDYWYVSDRDPEASHAPLKRARLVHSVLAGVADELVKLDAG